MKGHKQGAHTQTSVPVAKVAGFHDASQFEFAFMATPGNDYEFRSSNDAMMSAFRLLFSPFTLIIATALLIASLFWIFSMVASGYVGGVIGDVSFTVELVPGLLRFNLGTDSSAPWGFTGGDVVFRIVEEMREIFRPWTFHSDRDSVYIWIPLWMIQLPLAVIFAIHIIIRSKRIRRIRLQPGPK